MLGKLTKVLNTNHKSSQVKSINNSSNERDLGEEEIGEDSAKLSANDESLDVVWLVDDVVEAVGVAVDLLKGFLVPELCCNNRYHHAFHYSNNKDDGKMTTMQSNQL